MKLSQLQKRIQKTLSISKDIIQKAESRRNKDQRAVKQMSEAWALYKSNPYRVSWGDLSRDRYIACPKLASPAANAFPKKKNSKMKLELLFPMPLKIGCQSSTRNVQDLA